MDEDQHPDTVMAVAALHNEAGCHVDGLQSFAMGRNALWCPI